MTTKELSFNDLHIAESDVWRQMGYGETIPDRRVTDTTRQIMDETAQVVKPLFGYRVLKGEVEGRLLRVADKELQVGRTIATQLVKAEAFALFVVTAGREFEMYQQEVAARGDILEAFITDAVGSLVAEHCADQMETHLQASIDKLGWRHTNRFSPGYCHWPVSDQQALFCLLGNAPCGVTLHESSLMTPIKSVSGVIGLGTHVEHEDYACAFCNRTDCTLRKR